MDIIINGYNGKMGQCVKALAEKMSDVNVVAGVDKSADNKSDNICFNEISKVTSNADVIIDFSNKSAIPGLLDFAVNRQIPIVLCTTAIDEELNKKIIEASKKIAILKSANMSLGINMIIKLLKEASSLLFNEGFDIEIIEKHHRMKLDAPSGTALLLADTIKNELNDSCAYVYDRSNKMEQRSKNEIGIQSLRGGSIVGEHEIVFAGLDEIVSIKHEAFSRNIFAKGAILAAEFIRNKKTGLYSMQDVI